MSLSPEVRRQLWEQTREQTEVLLDDLQHIRSVIAKDDTDSGDVRRLSGILRRLLVNREITKIATPRIGKLVLSAPDNNPIYKAARKTPHLFFLSGRVNIFGWNGTLWAIDVDPGTPPEQYKQKVLPDDFDQERTIELRLENFLAQRVLCYRGQWANREQVIKYVANVASGVHTTAPRSKDQILLAQIRSANRISYRDGGVHVALLDHGLDSDETKFRCTPDSIDPVLIELLSAGHFLSISPEVKRLERVIAEKIHPGDAGGTS